MKTLTIRALLTAAILLCACGFAIARTHTVEKGETLESIAALYGISVDDLTQANPTAAKLFFVGQKLTVPDKVVPSAVTPVPSNRDETMANTGDVAPSSPTTSAPPRETQAPATESQSETDELDPMSPTNFSRLGVSWFAGYKTFEYGYYGLVGEYYSESGWGFNIGMHYSYGITKPGEMAYTFGPAYGYVVHPMLMINLLIDGYLYTYTDYTVNKYGNLESHSKVNGGIIAAPGLRLKFGKVSLGSSFYFGWENGNKKVSTAIELSLGIQFKNV